MSRIKHGCAIRSRNDLYKRAYQIWKSIKRRVKNPPERCYVNISLDKRWNEFGSFISDMGPPPSRKHSIDRKDFKLGYSKENCRWASAFTQARNRRGSLSSFSKYKGVSKNHNKFRARIKVFQKEIHIGSYSTQREAALAYNRAAKKFFGKDAYLNEVK